MRLAKNNDKGQLLGRRLGKAWQDCDAAPLIADPTVAATEQCGASQGKAVIRSYSSASVI